MSEIPDTKKTEIENYKSIKPESNISVKEAKVFLENKLNENDNSTEKENPRQENIDGKTYYYDDNGHLYREDKELLTNCEYTKNGYEYKTDKIGRIVSIEGKLHLKEYEGKLPIKDSLSAIGKGYQKEGDDRGHYIGDQFGGSNGLENMFPQDAKINQTVFAKFENQLASEVKNGNEVRVKIEPIYEENSRRPDGIAVIYSINGEQSAQIFPNRKE